MNKSCEDCLYAAPCRIERGHYYCEVDGIFLTILPVECRSFDPIDI